MRKTLTQGQHFIGATVFLRENFAQGPTTEVRIDEKTEA
jgi:hypothetical protein